MPGVTSTAINYVWFEAGGGNALISTVASETQLAYTPDQLCQALTAFGKDLNTYWQTYGRKFVPLDGPGSHSGHAQGSSCHSNYFYGSSCSSGSTADEACWRSDADTILAMKPRPAFVIANTEADPAFVDELAKHGMLVDGPGSAGDAAAFENALAPYVWSTAISYENDASFAAEYFCKKLAARPVQFAGPEVLRSGSNPLNPPIRKIGIVYDVTQPDYFTASEQMFVHALAGCGAGNVQVYPVNTTDTSQLPGEMQTVAAKIKIAGVTTVNLDDDFLTAALLSNDLDSEQWHPELVISGVGADDYDRIMQLGNQNSYRYLFGLGIDVAAAADGSYDGSKAWTAGGATGQAPLLAILNMWPWFPLAGDMFQVAGPSPTVAAIQKGMFNLPLMGGTDPTHPFRKWGEAPDGFAPQQSVRELWWCPTQTSPEDNKSGAFVPVLGNRWFQHGQIDGTVRVFPNGVCA